MVLIVQNSSKINRGNSTPGRILQLPDGRKIGYLVLGEGKPIFYFHGTASSRLEILLLKNFAFSNHFRLIAVDRPGYGLSDFADHKKLGTFNNDVNFLADHLGINVFAALSWSGGGPFALSYAAQYPKRVSRLVTVGSPALPFDVSTAHNNNPLARFAMKIPFLGMYALRTVKNSILKANKDVKVYLKSNAGKSMLHEWPKPDAKFFGDTNWLQLMYSSMAEGFRQGDNGVKAVFQEHSLFMKAWDEPLSQIPSEKLVIWQGAQDKTCPIENAYKISRITGGQVRVFKEEGHCVLFSKIENLKRDLNPDTAHSN
jgi:pimeloyl-ACP methyl ester carboxylesterase